MTSLCGQRVVDAREASGGAIPGQPPRSRRWPHSREVVCRPFHIDVHLVPVLLFAGMRPFGSQGRPDAPERWRSCCLDAACERQPADYPYGVTQLAASVADPTLAVEAASHTMTWRS